jgi:RND family efflux transporter MFP subunit
MALDDLAALKIDQSHRAGTGRAGMWITLVVLAALAGTGAWFWATRVEAVQVTVATITAKTGGASASGTVLNASGYVTARRRATVSSKVTGKVLEVFVEEGKSVRAGQVLARLDDSQARAALAVAEAQLGASQKGFAEDQARLREAEQNLDRRERLLKEQVVGKAEVDSAQSEVDALKARIAYSQQQIAVAQSQVHMRQTDLDDMVVRAPFSGVAISKDAQPGEMVSPVSAGGGFTRTGICTIVDMASLEIEVDVNESYINRVRSAQKVEAVLDAYPDWRIPAHVITTVPTADRQKATVRVRIGFDPSTGSGQAPSTGSGQAPSASSGLDPRILPDMGVKVSFLREDEPPQAATEQRPRMLAPKTAVRQADGKSVVFVVRDDRVERRAVQVGSEEGDQVEVLSGLSSGDRIVVDAPPTLKDGDRIRIS